jgi:hypothetical protein
MPYYNETMIRIKLQNLASNSKEKSFDKEQIQFAKTQISEILKKKLKVPITLFTL